MNAWGLTDKGKSRHENQDYYFIDLVPEEKQAICVVCDGMGGAKAGNIASELSARVFVEEMHQRLKPKMSRRQRETALQDSVTATNELVYRKSREHSELTGMGTTVVGFLASDGQLSIVNVGDSRAYLINEDGIARITRDHSLVEDMVQRGDLTPEQARQHPSKNLITRALGTASTVRGDYYSMDMEPGDVILLCTDGLSNLVSDQEILYEVIHGGELDSCCQRLLNIVAERGAPDNVTVVVFRNDPLEEVVNNG